MNLKLERQQVWITAWRGWSALLCILVLTSCAGAGKVARSGKFIGSGGQGTPEVISLQDWVLEFQVSGGFAGRDEMLHLTGDGFATVFDKRIGAHRKGRVAPERQETIAALLVVLETREAADVFRSDSSRCRDCLVFSLILPGEGKPETIRITSDRLADSPYRELIACLLAIMTDLAKIER